MKIQTNLLRTFTSMTFTHTKHKYGKGTAECYDAGIHVLVTGRDWIAALVYIQFISIPLQGSTDIILVTFW